MEASISRLQGTSLLEAFLMSCSASAAIESMADEVFRSSLESVFRARTAIHGLRVEGQA